MMVHFRNRFSTEHHQRINSKIIAAATASDTQDEGAPPDTDDNDGDGGDSPVHAGKLLVDATCTPTDIRFPTDLSLLGEAREKTEAVIDQFHGWITGQRDEPVKKPRTYRQKARKQYLAVAKQKKPGAKKIRKAIGQQLNYVRRNLGHIARMVEAHPGMLGRLRRYDYKCLLVIHTLYDRQRQMHSQRVLIVL
jgi:hypothetical protein